MSEHYFDKGCPNIDANVGPGTEHGYSCSLCRPAPAKVERLRAALEEIAARTHDHRIWTMERAIHVIAIAALKEEKKP